MLPATASPRLPLLELRGVSVRYRGASKLALDGVDLTVEPGTITALLGANGAGKSTLLRVAAGLVAPTSGTARLEGEDPARLERRVVAQRVALVPQSEPAPAGFRVGEIVAMGRAPHQGGWMTARPEDEAAVTSALARCDLAALADRQVSTLSGGEQRRVAVARALAQRPRLLALDEPAAFLDVRHRLELGDLLARVAREEGVACLVAMHDLDAAARSSGHVVLLRGGRVVASGPPAEVMTPAWLREAFDVEIEVVEGRSGVTFVASRAAGDGG